MENKTLLCLKKNKNGTSNIYIQYCNDGVFLKSTEVTVRLNAEQIEFFKRKQKLSSKVLNYEILNNKIIQEQNKLNETIKKFLDAFNKYPSKAELASYLMYIPGSNKTGTENYIDCLARFIERKSLSRDAKQYKTLYKHLIEYVEWKGLSKEDIYFSTLQVSFFKDFFTFLSKDVELRQNGKTTRKRAMCDNALKKFSYTIASSITQIKKYQMAEYDRDDILDHIHLAVEELNVTTHRNKQIVLSHHEVAILTNFRLKNGFMKNKKGLSTKRVSAETLERVKNLFILQTIKGVRHSDVHQLNKRNVYNGSVFVRQKKTHNQYNVPVDEVALTLMERANSKNEISNQKYNDYLKVIFDQFFPYYKEQFRKDDPGYRLDGYIEVKYYLGVPKEIVKTKAEMAKTHMARRTYVSVAQGERGKSDIEVQSNIGQTNVASLFPYKIYNENSPRDEVFKIQIDKSCVSDLRMSDDTILQMETKNNQNDK
jgi:hypothetical protein